ncbi:hypothetical protein NA56DRAFT_644462 [Hyaloscypha hepaticicola]|uniref:Uncharacterized protein n=1 Tax=Hyaloscypha hepaticicola TaxID=2082293 RepID=A0A2J6Q9C0_9HELO|nr:hypothetical protein NA56DRAFT_644462 [Hyaloscypha hepaticicola]
MQCTGDFDIIDGMQAHQEDTQLPYGAQVQGEGISWDFELPERQRDPSSRSASHFYHHSRDSGICLEHEEEADPKPKPSRPQLRSFDNFPSDYVSAQGDKKHRDDEPTNSTIGERFRQRQQSDSTLSSQSAESEQSTESKQSTVIINNGRTLSLAGFEQSMKPNTLSGYPIPHNLRFHSQPTQPKQLFLDERPKKKEHFPSINSPFRQRQDSLKETRRKMYSFFHRYYQSGGSPIDQKEYPLMAEGLWHINREHASHLVRELDEIVRHQTHGGDQMCCIPILPRCVVRELPRPREEPPEKWLRTIDEAWANRPRKYRRQWSWFADAACE